MAAFRFWTCSNSSDYELLIRQALAESEIQQLLANTLGIPDARIEQYHYRAGSDARRRRRYLGSVIRSAVLGHHIGRKGGLGLWGNASGSKVEPDSSWIGEEDGLPGCLETIHVAAFSSSREVWTEAKTILRTQGELGPEGRTFEVLLDQSPIALRVGWDRIESNTQAIAYAVSLSLLKGMSRGAPIRGFAFPLCVDYLIDGGELCVLEVHCPGRGFGPHLLPWISLGVGRVDELVSEMAIELSDVDRPKYQGQVGAFRHLDRILWQKVLSGPGGSPKVWWDDETLSWDSLPIDLQTRDFDYRVRLPKRMRHSAGAKLDLGVIRQELGDLVACKAPINAPWHRVDATRVRFFCLSLSDDRSEFEALAATRDLLVERAIISSTDQVGRSGELRSFCIARVS